MKLHLSPSRMLAIAAFVLAVVFGCSAPNAPMSELSTAPGSEAPQAPQEPQPPPGPQAPQFIRVPVSPFAQATASGPGSGGSSGPGSGGGADITQSAMILGPVGGNVNAGRFRVEVPAGAWIGLAQVTIVVPDESELQCELHIQNVLNLFAVPVALEVEWDGAERLDPDFDPADLRMTWLDETTGQWVVIPYSVDTHHETITSMLSHFSRYGVVSAKAGW
jgi:hypothetical protein